MSQTPSHPGPSSRTPPSPGPSSQTPPSHTPSIVFVCWGNICRSPMAERVARKWFDDAGVQADISSAGVSDEEGPSPMDRRARAVLEANGYDGSRHVAHQIDADEIDSADLVIAAEPMHVSMLRRISPHATNPRARKFSLICDYDPAKKPGTPLPDPWYGPDRQFVTTLRAIEAAMPGIVDAVRRLS